RPAPATGHSDTDSAVVITDVTTPLTAPDFRMASSTAANAQAAMVPTAYSAVVIPASPRPRSSRIRVRRLIVVLFMVPSSDPHPRAGALVPPPCGADGAARKVATRSVDETWERVGGVEDSPARCAGPVPA